MYRAIVQGVLPIEQVGRTIAFSWCELSHRVSKSSIDDVLISQDVLDNILHGEAKLHVGSRVLRQLPPFGIFTFDETHSDVCIGCQLPHLVVKVLESVTLCICGLMVTVQDQPCEVDESTEVTVSSGHGLAFPEKTAVAF